MSGVVAFARGGVERSATAVPVSADRSEAASSTRRLLAAAGAIGIAVALAVSSLGVPGWTVPGVADVDAGQPAGGSAQVTQVAAGSAQVAQPGGGDPASGAGIAPGGGSGGPARAILVDPGPSPTPALPSGPFPAAALEAALADATWRYGLPGVQAAIVAPDGRSWSGGSGVANVSTRRAVGSTTPFALGSMTKTFTAALILGLAEDGALGLDDRVIRWLPEYSGRTFLGTTAARRGAITIRMLLAHTSGLYDYLSSYTLDAKLRADKKRVWKPAALIPYIRKPWFAPGTAYAYSNTNYLLLGLIAERATGTTYPALVRTRILDPLGLGSLYMQVAEPVRGSPSKGYDFASLSRTAKPVGWSDGTKIMPFTAVTSAAGAAGAMAGTATDVARWGLALWGGTFLAPASLATMLSFDGTAAPGAADDYGLGVGRRMVGERLTYGHSGRLAGYRGVVRWVPELGVSIAVLTNQDRYDPDRVVEKLLGALAPIRPGPSPTPVPSPSPVPSNLPTPTPSVLPAPEPSADITPVP